ncbi:hypothetical protein HDV00_010550 [Rhizophlyctis rosea]|nr:hypothetical protein HDV00_010550 [Rhizophlyctis rosea]
MPTKLICLLLLSISSSSLAADYVITPRWPIQCEQLYGFAVNRTTHTIDEEYKPYYLTFLTDVARRPGKDVCSNITVTEVSNLERETKKEIVGSSYYDLNGTHWNFLQCDAASCRGSCKVIGSAARGRPLSEVYRSCTGQVAAVPLLPYFTVGQTEEAKNLRPYTRTDLTTTLNAPTVDTSIKEYLKVEIYPDAACTRDPSFVEVRPIYRTCTRAPDAEFNYWIIDDVNATSIQPKLCDDAGCGKCTTGKGVTFNELRYDVGGGCLSMGPMVDVSGVGWYKAVAVGDGTTGKGAGARSSGAATRHNGVGGVVVVIIAAAAMLI